MKQRTKYIKIYNFFQKPLTKRFLCDRISKRKRKRNCVVTVSAVGVSVEHKQTLGLKSRSANFPQIIPSGIV